MNRSRFFVFSLYFSVISSAHGATILSDGTIIKIETTNVPDIVNRVNVNERLNPFIGSKVQNGRRQYQTVVNGNPVTIEVIREDQLNGHGQIKQNQNYWQQMQNIFPIKPNQGSVFVSKANSPFPNIEIYDVYTNAGTNSNPHPMFSNQNINKYPNNLPYPNSNTYNNRYSTRPPMHSNGNYNSNQYPNGNYYPYQNQNQHYLNPNHNMEGIHDDVNQNGEKNINLSEIDKNKYNKNQQNHDLNRNETNTEHSYEDNNKNNVAGYIDKFPIILLNKNEIRR